MARSSLPDWSTAAGGCLYNAVEKLTDSSKLDLRTTDPDGSNYLISPGTSHTSLLAAELSRYDLDIVAISDTRLADQGSPLTELGGYTYTSDKDCQLINIEFMD